MAAKALKVLVRSGNVPSVIIFCGSFGREATSAARAVIRDYYVKAGFFQQDATFNDIRIGNPAAPRYEGMPSPIMVVDASAGPDIDMIRLVIQSFMKTLTPLNLEKFVLFDEADKLSYDNQRALRSLLEACPNTITIYTTNELDKIDPAIRSHAAGAIFKLKHPSVEVINLKKLEKDEALRFISEEDEAVRKPVDRVTTEIIEWTSDISFHPHYLRIPANAIVDIDVWTHEFNEIVLKRTLPNGSGLAEIEFSDSDGKTQRRCISHILACLTDEGRAEKLKALKEQT